MGFGSVHVVLMGFVEVDDDVVLLELLAHGGEGHGVTVLVHDVHLLAELFGEFVAFFEFLDLLVEVVVVELDVLDDDYLGFVEEVYLHHFLLHVLHLGFLDEEGDGEQGED